MATGWSMFNLKRVGITSHFISSLAYKGFPGMCKHSTFLPDLTSMAVLYSPGPLQKK